MTTAGVCLPVFLAISYLKGDTMNEIVGLNSLAEGETAFVRQINTKGGMRKRLFDIGLTENTSVICVGVSPLGDPKAYLIRGAVMAIRNKDSASVIVRKESGGFSE